MSSSNHEREFIRVDAVDKVTGKAKYPSDFDFPNQLIMKVLFSEKAHAIVKDVDCSAALAIPGVIAILTARDVPNNEFGLIKPDQPVLCGPGSNIESANRVRCVADKVALIIAETEEIAALARKAIKVTYEDLPIVVDVIKAFSSNEVLLTSGRWYKYLLSL